MRNFLNILTSEFPGKTGLNQGVKAMFNFLNLLWRRMSFAEPTGIISLSPVSNPPLAYTRTRVGMTFVTL